MTTNSKITHGVRGLLATGLAAMLVACGGGGGSSSDDSTGGSVPVATRGVITQLGSIYVNGVKYETPDGNSYSNDDSAGTVANYQIGQVVSLRGRRNDDGVTGTADEVEYEAEIEGAADASGDINGIVILRTPTTNASGISNPLSDGNRYEVSGVWIDDLTLEATFIKVDDDANDEIKGIVKNDGPTSFDVREITFNWTGTPDVSDGDFVEVHFDSCGGTAPNVTCTASIVELEDDVFDQAEGMEVEIEGAVNLVVSGCPAGADFKIDLTCIDWDNKPAVWMDGLTGPGDIVNGSRVEAEGHVIGGLLVADKVKGRGNRVRITSTASLPSTADFDLFFGAIQVTTSSVTEFEPGVLPITDGEGLEVRGIRTGPTSMLALRVKGESVNANRHELRAVVDENGADPSNNTITVMGISSVAGASTELEIEDVQIAPGSGSTTEAQIDAFLGLVDDDTDPANGPRDVVDVRIDTTTGDGSIGTPYPARQIELEEEDD